MANEKKSSSKRKPGNTIEDRENDLIAMATDLAEKKLRDGTASTPIIVHYLKLGSTKELLEREQTIAQNELLKAKAEAIKASKGNEEMYANAIEAIRSYRGETK